MSHDEFQMRDYIEEACDEIDAAVWSGDAFLDENHRMRFRWFMARWERGMKEREHESEEPCDEDHDG